MSVRNILLEFLLINYRYQFYYDHNYQYNCYLFLNDRTITELTE